MTDIPDEAVEAVRASREVRRGGVPFIDTVWAKERVAVLADLTAAYPLLVRAQVERTVEVTRLRAQVEAVQALVKDPTYDGRVRKADLIAALSDQEKSVRCEYEGNWPYEPCHLCGKDGIDPSHVQALPPEMIAKMNEVPSNE